MLDIKLLWLKMTIVSIPIAPLSKSPRSDLMETIFFIGQKLLDNPGDIQSPPTSNSPSFFSQNSLPDVSDLDIPIARRKSTCNCVNIQLQTIFVIIDCLI